MALSFAHGAIQWLAADAVNTTYTLSPGFVVKFIRVYWCGLQSATDAVSETVNLQRGVGFATGTTERRSVGSFSQDTAATSNCGTVASNDAIVCTTDGAGARDGLLDLSAFGSDVTFIVDDQAPANLTIFVDMWGGDDPTVFVVGDFAEPAATGNQSYTVTGFVAGATDQMVMVAGVQSIAAFNTAEAEASGLYVGFKGDSTSICVGGNADDGSATMDTDGWGQNALFVGLCAKAGGATFTANATFTSFDTNAFTLTWNAVAVTGRKSIFLAVKGGLWAAGEYLIDGSTLNATATVSGLPFVPIGVCLVGRNTTETTAPAVNDQLGIGTGTSPTSRRSMGMLDEDATANCEIDTTLQYDQVLCFPSTAGGLQSAYDINAMNSDGFQIIVDVAGGVASEWQGFFAFGSAPSALPPLPTIKQDAVHHSFSW